MSEIYKPNLSLTRVEGDIPTPTKQELTDMAGVYADAFAGAPWNEYTQCPSSGDFYGRDTQPNKLCECGEAELVLAYPSPQTEDYITGELARPDSSLFLLKNEEDIVGFTWGFSYEHPEQFAKEKYQTSEMQEKVVRSLGCYGIDSTFYYLSESAILDDPRLRGRGISLQFHQVRLQVAKENALPAVQRTSSEGPMYRTSLKSGMTQIMGPEVIVDTQAQKFNRTGRIVNNIIDTEMEPRVLFVK